MLASRLSRSLRPVGGASFVQGSVAPKLCVELGPVSMSSSEDSGLLREGDRLGRYVVLEHVGSGAMGIVYAAYDPELDRKVAIKLLRPAERSKPSGQAENRARLLREAQAMARLSHPNLVTVHDVGALDDRVFLAMELIDGPTLTTWLAASPRSWQEVLEVFGSAGLGLAAAHDAGLVHRDFKPDNVLLDQDGRVVVMDFGLARAVAGRTDAHPDLKRAEAASPSSLELTRSGMLMGTPAYMAPEQLEGEASNAKADHFSFCVALYQGLYGERPFAGETLGELMATISAGRIRPAGPGTMVPARIRRALVQGLSFDPEHRHRDMRTLLAALTRDPARRWKS
jgi:eukaryotic-like serine/threonine-protein kinase